MGHGCTQTLLRVETCTHHVVTGTYDKRYNYILANINSESSRVIFSFFFVFIQWVKHFCTPANFVTICSTVLNHKKIFIYNLCFGLSKLYTNIQQDQKAKLDYHMSMLFAYMAGGEGVGVRGFKMSGPYNKKSQGSLRLF